MVSMMVTQLYSITSVLIEAQLSEIFTDGFEVEQVKDLFYATFTKYNDDVDAEIVFEKLIYTTIGEVAQNNNLKQLRIAETEKYPHVTL